MTILCVYQTHNDSEMPPKALQIAIRKKLVNKGSNAFHQSDQTAAKKQKLDT